MAHPRARLHDELATSVRLSLVAALVQVEELDFPALRDVLEVSDSVLSKQMTLLEEAGFLKIRKGYEGKRPRTWLGVSSKGRKAYKEHRQALLEIISGTGKAKG